MRLSRVTTEKEKYEYLVAALPTPIMDKVYDLVINEPVANPFTTIMKRIETEFKPTESKQIKKLLKGMTRGDQKPSQFLKEMRELAQNEVSDNVLWELFLAQLPPITAGVLEMMSEEDLDALAKAADKGWARESEANIAATSAPSQCDHQLSSSALVNKMIEALDSWSKTNRKGGQMQERTDRRQSRSRSQTPASSSKNEIVHVLENVTPSTLCATRTLNLVMKHGIANLGARNGCLLYTLTLPTIYSV